MGVEELRLELVEIINNLASKGFENIDPGTSGRLDALANKAGEIGMNEGKRLINNLSGAIKTIKEGKTRVESAKVRLTALEFYVQNLAISETTEDL